MVCRMRFDCGVKKGACKSDVERKAGRRVREREETLQEAHLSESGHEVPICVFHPGRG